MPIWTSRRPGKKFFRRRKRPIEWQYWSKYARWYPPLWPYRRRRRIPAIPEVTLSKVRQPLNVTDTWPYVSPRPYQKMRRLKYNMNQGVYNIYHGIL